MPAEVDLTAVGTRDWMHWGERGGRSTIRKRSGSGEIIDGVATAPGSAGTAIRSTSAGPTAHRSDR
ncbi:hypothetical protein NKG94_27945 [Micromonospora sp. M12]